MYLIQVDVIGTKTRKADINILCHGIHGAGHALGGQHEMLPDPLQRLTQVAFTDGIAPGSVDIIDTGIQKLTDQNLCAGGVDPLNGNAAKAHAGDPQTGFS